MNSVNLLPYAKKVSVHFLVIKAGGCGIDTSMLKHRYSMWFKKVNQKERNNRRVIRELAYRVSLKINTVAAFGMRYNSLQLHEFYDARILFSGIFHFKTLYS